MKRKIIVVITLFLIFGSGNIYPMEQQPSKIEIMREKLRKLEEQTKALLEEQKEALTPLEKLDRLKNLLAPLLNLTEMEKSKFVAPKNLDDLKKSEQFYYSPYYVAREIAAGNQPHTPCMFLIDQKKDDKFHPAVKFTFLYGLIAGISPIIITYEPFCDFFNANEGFTLNSFYPWQKFCANWDVHEVPNSQFLLILPRNNIFLGFNLAQLPTLISKDLNPYKDIKQFEKFMWDTRFKHCFLPKPFTPDNLETIFEGKNAKQPSQIFPIFDFYVDGHGGIHKTLAGLPPQDLNALLKFFDNSLDVGVVVLSSCYIGGLNKELLKKNAQNIDIAHKYPLIVLSSTNETTYTLSDSPYLLTSYFNQAAQLFGKGKPLLDLLNTLAVFQPNPKSPQGALEIPQIWLPGGLDFQALNFTTEIINITNVLSRISLEEHKPIVIENKRAVLLYPAAIFPTIEIAPRKYSPEEFKQTFLNKVATEDVRKDAWKTMPGLDQLLAIKSKVFAIHKTPALYYAFTNGLLSAQNLKDESFYLYPQCISLNNSVSFSHRFEHIEVKNKQNPLLGIFRFIRDAFFGSGNVIGNEIYIDLLSGPNDISALIEASSYAIQGEANPSLDSFQTLLKDTYFKTINLKRVIIKAFKFQTGDAVVFTISFECADKAWMMMQLATPASKNIFWNQIKEHDLKKHRQSWELAPSYEAPSCQKTISQVLEQKKRKGKVI